MKEQKDGDYQINCGVPEEAFPCLQHCCEKYDSLADIAYGSTCPHCVIWTSMPDSVDLAVNYILECLLYGYGKRIKG